MLDVRYSICRGCRDISGMTVVSVVLCQIQTYNPENWKEHSTMWH